MDDPGRRLNMGDIALIAMDLLDLYAWCADCTLWAVEVRAVLIGRALTRLNLSSLS
jgi:hypothetical protein